MLQIYKFNGITANCHRAFWRDTVARQEKLCGIHENAVSHWLFLYKTGCTRQFESKLSLHSLALSLNKTCCDRQFESKILLRSLALSLNKTGWDRQFESKISLRSLVLFFDKRKRRKRFRITLKSVSHSLIRSSVSRFYCYRKPVLRQTCHRKGSPTAPKRLFRTVKMPFPYCETGFPAGRKSLSCNVEKAFANDKSVYISLVYN